MAYERRHPSVLLVYYLSVTLFLMFTSHPLLRLIALCGAVLLMLSTGERAPKLRTVLFLSGMVVLTIIINPLFSHRGATELFFFNNRPITLEAIMYGAGVACLMLSVILWFHLLSRMLDSEKLLTLLGGVMPKTAFLVSSALRMVPFLRRRAEAIQSTGRSMGLYGTESIPEKLSGSGKAFSALVTNSMEHAMDAGASMKARGYGSHKRTHYKRYRFRRGDLAAIVLILCLDAGISVGLASGEVWFTYYPRLAMHTGPKTNLVLILYALLVLLGPVAEWKERLKWKYYVSKI